VAPYESDAQLAYLTHNGYIEGVKYIVAPYESDAQLAYLTHNGYIDLVITEDSDLLVYGCNKVRLACWHWFI
jgi:5'-3' exonuclease